MDYADFQEKMSIDYEVSSNTREIANLREAGYPCPQRGCETQLTIYPPWAPVDISEKVGFGKKRLYDATVAGIESEVMQLEHGVRACRQDVDNDQSRFHYLNMQIEMADIAQQRVMQEMNAYIGGDEALEQQQKSRGFKSYRELYNKRLLEQENLAKGLRHQQKEVKAKHEPNVKQLKMFQDVRNLLALKSAHNAKVLSGELKSDIKPLNVGFKIKTIGHKRPCSRAFSGYSQSTRAMKPLPS